MIADVHCHFFSSGFFRALGRGLAIDGDAASVLPSRLGWEPPGDDTALADRWVSEMDRHGVARAMLIASLPGDEPAIAAAVERHPDRIIGAFMVDAGAPDAVDRVQRGLTTLRLRTVCLFPAMHRVALDDPRTDAVFEMAARHGGVVFAHCGVLSIGVRKKLGLPSPFDLKLGDPLVLAAVAVRYPNVPVIVPHFGAGFFREALMAADVAGNIHLDTSSSNSWIRYTPGLGLADVFARALELVGASRLLFGTDSSFFPRGWQRKIYEDQRAVFTDIGASHEDQALIFAGNFSRLFGAS